MNFQDAEATRNQNRGHECPTGVKSQLAKLTVLQLYHRPLPLPPAVSNSSCPFTQHQPLCASYCSVLLHFSRFYKIKNAQFFVFVFYVLFVWNVLQTYYSESRSVVSNSLQPHGLCNPWNSLGQNTRVGSLSLLQGIFPSQGSNPGLPHCRQILYQLSHREAQEYWSG